MVGGTTPDYEDFHLGDGHFDVLRVSEAFRVLGVVSWVRAMFGTVAVAASLTVKFP